MKMTLLGPMISAARMDDDSTGNRSMRSTVLAKSTGSARGGPAASAPGSDGSGEWEGGGTDVLEGSRTGSADREACNIPGSSSSSSFETFSMHAFFSRTI